MCNVDLRLPPFLPESSQSSTKKKKKIPKDDPGLSISLLGQGKQVGS